ncbi:hypothetical protein K6X08_32980, partial [Burkholderia contaminans]|nr:hypothetical protein [Burkholderia contaminans]
AGGGGWGARGPVGAPGGVCPAPPPSPPPPPPPWGGHASLIACVTRVRRNAFVKRLPFRERITASTHQPEQTAAMP